MEIHIKFITSYFCFICCVSRGFFLLVCNQIQNVKKYRKYNVEIKSAATFDIYVIQQTDISYIYYMFKHDKMA